MMPDVSAGGSAVRAGNVVDVVPGVLAGVVAVAVGLDRVV